MTNLNRPTRIAPVAGVADAPRAVIYVRVSTEAQADQGTSLATQRAACLVKAAAMEAQVVGIFADEGVSGAFYKTRAGVQEALQCIEEGHADTLIAYKLDRTGRDVDVIRDVFRRVEAAGGKVVFADGTEFKANAVGGLMLTQLAAFAEYEKRVIKERMVAGRRKRAESGEQVARGMSPYGYHIVNRNDVIAGRYPASLLGKYVVKDDEAANVRFMFEQYAAGWSLYRIAKHLYETGTPAPRGKLWHAESIRLILKNSVHKGEPNFGSTEVVTDELRRDRGFRQLHYYRPAAPDKVVHLSAPAIVSAELWQAVQERFAENLLVNNGRRDRKWFLTGLLRCPLCNRNMAGRLRRPGFGRSHYSCRCSHPSLSADQRACYPHPLYQSEIEGAVIDAIAALATGRVSLEAAYAAFMEEGEKEPGEDDTERREVEAALVALSNRERATITAQIAAVQAGADPQAFNAIFGEIRQERERLNRRRDALTLAAPSLIPDRAEREAEVRRIVTDAAATVRELLSAEELTPCERQELLARVVCSIVPVSDGLQEDGKPNKPTSINLFLRGSDLSHNVVSQTPVK